jgi:hypothetical protein
MRHKIIILSTVLAASSPELFAQQTTPPDSTRAQPQLTVQADSAKNQTEASADSSHSRKVLWWTVGIILFIGLNLLISDRPSK